MNNNTDANAPILKYWQVSRECKVPFMMAVVAGDFAAHLAGVRARDEEKLEWMQVSYAMDSTG